MIQCYNLSKTYVNKKGIAVEAIDSISCEIKDGEFVSVIGKSGSGKSTFLKLIGGILLPSSGTILIDGMNTSEVKGEQLSDYRNQHIGFVFQSFLLEESLTALENVALPAMIKGEKKRKCFEKAMELLTSVGMDHRAENRPSELSGGEQQRVCIARALINNPDIILADEPTGNLDEENGKMIMDLLLSLSKNKTLVLVTHDLELAQLADRRLMIKDGKLC